MGLQSVIRFLIPREDHFYDFLEQQAVVAHKGALALASFKDGDVARVRDAVQQLEHDGDKIVHAMEEALAKTFVTPIDREDLQKLSSELDDVLDLMNGTIRAAALYGVVRPTEPMLKLIDVLIRCTELLEMTIPNLRKHRYKDLVESARAIRKLEKEGDAIFRSAVSALFHDSLIDAKQLLREKEVLEDLENAIDVANNVADTLTNLAVKHG
jgi:uncharacterized protein Yka (UPF0111/DUF47 family)